MKRVVRALDRFIAYLSYAGISMAVACLSITMAMIIVGVVMRYIFNNPLIFVEEFSSYFFVLLVYLAFAYCTRTEAHISVDVIVRRLPRTVRAGLEIATLLLTLILVGIYFWFALRLFLKSIEVGEVSISIFQVPMWIPYMLPVIGFIFLALEIVALTVKKSMVFQRGYRKGQAGRRWGMSGTS